MASSGSASHAKLSWATAPKSQPAAAEPYAAAEPITAFEKKFLASGHELWRCRVNFG